MVVRLVVLVPGGPLGAPPVGVARAVGAGVGFFGALPSSQPARERPAGGAPRDPDSAGGLGGPGSPAPDWLLPWVLLGTVSGGLFFALARRRRERRCAGSGDSERLLADPLEKRTKGT